MYTITYNVLKVAALFTGDYSGQFYLRQISRLSGLPLKTVQNSLKILEENKVVIGKVDGKNKYFSINKGNILAKFLLIQAEIWKTTVFIEKYPAFKTFLKAIGDNTLVIAFGSFARFKASEDSDIDLLVVPEKASLPFHLMPYKVHQIGLSESAFFKAVGNNEVLLKEIEKSHIILNNHSFYVNALWSFYGK
jgi:hypothetical protein